MVTFGVKLKKKMLALSIEKIVVKITAEDRYSWEEDGLLDQWRRGVFMGQTA